MTTMSPCDEASLEELLTGELADERLQALEAHLEHCAGCRARLDGLAADPAEWQEVKDGLSDSEPDFSVVGERSPRTAGDDVLRYLAPTDDPHMLGRLGGYEIAGVIGIGGMGVVLKGFDRALNRFVAIKVLAPHLAANGSARRRFAREAQAAAAVVHENVIAIHGVAELGALPYLVMALSRGQSLQKRLDERGTLSLVEVLRIGHQIAAGLAAAHAQGLVHRDIKPANILLEDGIERLKITDFGLARAADDASLTQEGTLAGTPLYMSPEQARGEAVDARSDLFSLGSLLYAACAGRAPFRADTSYGILRRITDSTPRRLVELKPEIPVWFDGIVLKLLAKNPAERYMSAAELADLLQACLAHVQQPTVSPLPIEAARCAGAPRRSRAVIGSAAVLIAIIGVACVTSLLGFLSNGDAKKNTEPRALSGYIRSLSFSADGRWLAVGCSDHPQVSHSRAGVVQIWNVPERRLSAAIAEKRGINSVAFAPAGDRVALATADGVIKVIVPTTGAALLSHAIGSASPAVSFSPQGAYFGATNMKGEIVLWKAATLERHALDLDGDPLPLLTLCFSDDESKLAAGGGTFAPEDVSGNAAVWDLKTGRRLMHVRHAAAVMDVAFSPDGQRLATASLDTRANLWEIATGVGLKSFRDTESGLVRARFLAKGDDLATLGPSSGIKLWDLAKPEPIERLRFDATRQTALCVSSDGALIAVGGHDRLVRLWDVAARKPIAELNALRGAESP